MTFGFLDLSFEYLAKTKVLQKKFSLKAMAINFSNLFLF